MGFSVGIVGLPNVGKSSLFNALTKAGAESSNYPFTTIDPNVGQVPVPDPRFDTIVKLVNPKSQVPAIMSFTDIAGLVAGAHAGEGLGNQFLSHIREVQAIVHVVRAFEDGNITHIGDVDPLRDLEIIHTELALKDLDTLAKRKAKTERAARSGDKQAKAEIALIEKLEVILNGDALFKRVELDSEEEQVLLRDLALLSFKPLMLLANIGEEDIATPMENPHFAKLSQETDKIGVKLVPVCARIEAELSELEPDEMQGFLDDLGLEESALPRLIREGYALLDLITYFTAGEKEVRGWTIRQGTKAPQAAGKIHSDFERGFIRAEIVSYQDFVAADGSYARIRELGQLRAEGKDYVMADGDVTHFRFNV